MSPEDLRHALSNADGFCQFFRYDPLLLLLLPGHSQHSTMEQFWKPIIPSLSLHCPRLCPIQQSRQYQCTMYFFLDGHAQLPVLEGRWSLALKSLDVLPSLTITLPCTSPSLVMLLPR